MKHLSVDVRDDAVKQFVLELSRDPGGSVLELNGQAVVRVLPLASPNGHAPGDEWTNAMNERRCDLVDRKIDGTITPDELRELSDLQRQMLRYRDQVAPLPLEEARRLHQELLELAQAHRANDNP